MAFIGAAATNNATHADGFTSQTDYLSKLLSYTHTTIVS